MRWHKLAGAGIAMAAAAAAGGLFAGGVGNAATTAPRSGARAVAPVPPPPQPSRAAIRASAASASASTAKMYLHVDGVSGEVTDLGYAGTIAAYSFSWGVSNPADGTGKPVLSSLSLQIAFDKAEPKLETDAETGATIPSVTLTEVATGGSKVRTETLTNARLESLSIGGASGGSASVSLSLSFEQRRITDYYTDSAGTQHSATSCWNVANNNTSCA